MPQPVAVLGIGMIAAGSSVTVIQTSGVEPLRRLDYWRDMISATFVALDCEAPAKRDFSGALETNVLQDLQFSRVTADAQHVVRSPQRIRQSRDDFFLISLQCDGEGCIAQGERVAMLRPGDFALYDTAQPYELNFEGAFEQLVLRLPRHYLSRRIACPERLTAVPFRGTQGACAVVSSFVLQLYRQLDRLDRACATAMHETLLDLVVIGLSDALTGSSPTANRLVVKQRIRKFVEARLADSSLDCQQIAAAHGISVRYLNKLFEDEELLLSEWIWSRRLEKARAAIERSRTTGQSITQIAYDWGFKDPAHFSRAFKARYHATPSDYRNTASGKQEY